jgi:hypothetical protein
LDIEKDEIGLFVLYRFDRRNAVAALSDQFDILLVAQKALHAVACKRFIVDYQRADGH